jgi:D-arginine dehydrogenase
MGTVHDVAVIGAGMVGASIAYHLSRADKTPDVVWLEAESAPGYHSTGRSAALYAPSYGPDQIRALTRSGRDFFNAPPAGFTSVPLLTPRGVMLPARAGQTDGVHALARKLDAAGQTYRLFGVEEAQARVPVLRAEAAALSLLDDTAMDIDVDALLQGYLRGARACGVTMLSNARVSRLERQVDGGTGHWRITTEQGATLLAKVIVNAAGAWADAVGRMAGAASIGLEPRRRSAFIFAAPADGAGQANASTHAAAHWPAVIDIDEQWYFKPDAGAMLGSPANADPVAPHDVVPEEFDIALGIHRIEEATTMTIRRPKSTWAGLRSFVADGEPVVGFDAKVPGFFWAAALGGYGIKTSPSVGRLSAALLNRQAVAEDLLAMGVDGARLSASRLHR